MLFVNWYFVDCLLWNMYQYCSKCYIFLNIFIWMCAQYMWCTVFTIIVDVWVLYDISWNKALCCYLRICVTHCNQWYPGITIGYWRKAYTGEIVENPTAFHDEEWVNVFGVYAGFNRFVSVISQPSVRGKSNVTQVERVYLFDETSMVQTNQGSQSVQIWDPNPRSPDPGMCKRHNSTRECVARKTKCLLLGWSFPRFLIFKRHKQNLEKYIRV